MASVQMTIPFKSRKRYVSNSKLSKNYNIENVDIVNLANTRHSGTVKRTAIESNCNFSDDESCSPTKIARKTKERENERDRETNSAIAEKLPSREKEIHSLHQFLSDHLKNETSGSLYISGQPGTGKTATLSCILQLPEFKNGYKEVFVNCTMMKSAGSIFMRICKELNIKITGTTEKSCLKAIDAYLSKPHKMILLVLDEIDQLDSQRQSVLYTIFEWPARINSHLVLIGIANALDLTDRVLPRLQTNCEMRPKLMHFPPYTKDQIINIFTNTLIKESNGNLFSPVALQMLAAKIAAISGDMRRALDIGRRVIELARKNNFNVTQNVDKMINDNAITVELKQVLSVLNDIYGSSQNLQDNVDEAFPLQQKLLICSLMLMLTKGKNKDIVVGKLYDVYKRVATSRNIAAVDSIEFYSLCSLVETRGIIRLSGKKEPRSQKVSLQWDQGEVQNALRDKTLIAEIMNDVKCLSR